MPEWFFQFVRSTYFLCTKISTFHNELIIEIAFDIIFCPDKGAVIMFNCVALVTIRCADCVLADKYYTAEEQGEDGKPPVHRELDGQHAGPHIVRHGVLEGEGGHLVYLVFICIYVSLTSDYIANLTHYSDFWTGL